MLASATESRSAFRFSRGHSRFFPDWNKERLRCPLIGTGKVALSASNAQNHKLSRQSFLIFPVRKYESGRRSDSRHRKQRKDGFWHPKAGEKRLTRLLLSHLLRLVLFWSIIFSTLCLCRWDALSLQTTPLIAQRVPSTFFKKKP
jgi:hypothetical protein